MGLILLIILIILLIGALPSWPYSREWGYSPISILGILFIIVLILVLTRVIVFWDGTPATAVKTATTENSMESNNQQENDTDYLPGNPSKKLDRADGMGRGRP
jgi:hypothetical protein